MAHPQSNGTRQSHAGGSAESTLTITATVQATVSIDMSHAGEQRVIVANAPDPKESFYRSPLSRQSKTVNARAEIRKKAAADPSEAAVAYSFPAKPGQFEVIRTTRVMDVSDGGKTHPQAVAVITVVAR